ncbi:hypothetical protein [Mycoplasmopsis adleri]|uniref:hypothetical protein n=1 Tax=Mycoplasmopsis adleri TaxID=51362 RepID=UPI0038732AFA
MELKKDNFKRIAENRVSKIVSTLNQLTNLSNSSFYEYTDEEIEEMFETIINEAQKTKNFLLNANKKKINRKIKL